MKYLYKKGYPLSALKQQQQLWEFNHVLEDISSDHNNDYCYSMLNLNLFIEWLLWPFFTHINIYSSKILLLYPTKHDMSLEMNKMMPITYLGFSKRTYALIYELEMIFKKFLSGHNFSINQTWFRRIGVKIAALYPTL